MYIYIYIFFFFFKLFSPQNHGGIYHCVDLISDIDEFAQDTHNWSRDSATCANTERFFSLLLKSWIQRRWTQLCRCENFSKYDCSPVSGSTTYTTWPSCPQKFWESFFCCFFFQEHYLITLIMTYIFYLFIYFLDWLSCLYCNCCTVCWSLFFLRALGTISWFHCRHRWMRYKYPQLQYGQLRLLQILRDRSIALVVLEIQICRHKIRYTSGLPEILDTWLTGATASFAHLPRPLFPFSPVTHYHDHGTFCRLHFRHRWIYWRYPQL